MMDLNSPVVPDGDGTELSTSTRAVESVVPSLNGVAQANHSATASASPRAGSARRLSARLAAGIAKTPRSLAKGAMNALSDSADLLMEIVDGESPKMPVGTLRSPEEEEQLRQKIFGQLSARRSARGQSGMQELEA